MKSTLWIKLILVAVLTSLPVAIPAVAAEKKSPPAESIDPKTEKINLNTADEKIIAAAKGVGAKLAAELVKNRPFRTWDEVAKVQAIGQGKRLEILKSEFDLKAAVTVTHDKGEKEKKVAKGDKIDLKKSDAPAKPVIVTSPKSAALEKPQPVKPTAHVTPEPVAPVAVSKPDATAPTASIKPAAPKAVAVEKPEAAKLAPGAKININTATAEEIDQLPDIGPVKAKAIVDYRTENGPFKSPEDIEKVRGIKEGTFNKIKDYITVR